MTEEVLMIPVQEFKQLQDYYKGKLTESALLNKASRLAAEEQLILKDKRIPDSMAVKMTKPLATEQGRLVKRIRTGKTGPISYTSADEPEGMVDSPAENLLKQILKGVNKEPPAPPAPVTTVKVIKQEPSGSSIKRKKKGPTPSTSFEPSTSKKPSTSTKKSFGKTVLSAATKGVLRSLGIDDPDKDKDKDDEGGYSPRGKSKKYPKAKKTETQKLQEGWEDWDFPLRGQLGYDTDSD